MFWVKSEVQVMKNFEVKVEVEVQYEVYLGVV